MFRPAQTIGRTPQKIHIERFVKELNDLSPLVNKDDNLQQLVLQHYGTITLPDNPII